MYKCNEYFWEKTDVYHKDFRKLSKWVEDLNIFEYTGAMTIIINNPY